MYQPTVCPCHQRTCNPLSNRLTDRPTDWLTDQPTKWPQRLSNPQTTISKEATFLWSQLLRNSCPCTPKLPNLAITCVRGMYKRGTNQRVRMLRMVLFAVISLISTMVVRVILQVARRICCIIYVKYGTECVGIKVVTLWTNNLTKMLNWYSKGFTLIDFYLCKLCLQPLDPNIVGKLRLSAFFMSY